jgi:hypothetical protein
MQQKVKGQAKHETNFAQQIWHILCALERHMEPSFLISPSNKVLQVLGERDERVSGQGRTERAGTLQPCMLYTACPAKRSPWAHELPP